MIRPAVLVAVLAAALATACGSQASAGAPAGQAPAAASKPKTAEEITKAIIAKVPSVSLTKTYTASDDPNHLLGRPGSYEGKTAFADSRVPADQLGGTDNDAVERGGSVEVFADQSGAKSRMDLIQGVSQKMGGMIAEYDYVSGGVLVRVSHFLTPDQAKEYDAALKGILG